MRAQLLFPGDDKPEDSKFAIESLDPTYVIYTIGSGNKKWEDFQKQILDKQISKVIDVRDKTSKTRSHCYLPQEFDVIGKDDGLGTRLLECYIRYEWWWTLRGEKDVVQSYHSRLFNDILISLSFQHFVTSIETSLTHDLKIALFSNQSSHEQCIRTILAESVAQVLRPLDISIVHL